MDETPQQLTQTQASSRFFSVKRHTVTGAHFGSGQIALVNSNLGDPHGGSVQVIEDMSPTVDAATHKPVRLLTKSDMAKTLHTLTSPHRQYFIDNFEKKFAKDLADKSIIKRKPVPLKKVATVTQKQSANFFRASSIGSVYRDPVTDRAKA